MTTSRMTKKSAYQKIAKLVERFDEQFDSYKKSEYNETSTRRDFIDPFFKALGWDVDNENGYAESYREVIHEDKIRIGTVTKAPDYSFRLPGGKRLFFVEAKKPSVDIKGEIQAAFQVRRYGWSAKLPISIITDFEEFAVYDCTKKPSPNDKASKARIRYLTFRNYLNEFDFLWDTFSKENVLKGIFDKFVQNGTYKRGTTTVDQEFLQSLDSWRVQLASSLARVNKQLSNYNQLSNEEINFAVQQTIDRIIFLRIAEDRNVEQYDLLKKCVVNTHSDNGVFYKNLFRLFERAGEKYNSGLFDFEKDTISATLNIDNKTLKTIINDLYYPGPYDFSVMPVEILGSAYEQFLGKTIRVTSGYSVKIEEKPEVRKTGGVYYTPQYVVDYIVQNTVGKLLDGKTPKETSNIKIADPACGSGSFLLGAYQYLLDWHLNFYTQHKNKNSRPRGLKNDVLTPDGNLTTAEKKRILINNIFGVDIDANAVEVTKLSLLLKCLEGETQASIEQQRRLFHDRVLPTLDNNIRCGNSLVDTDFYGKQLNRKPDRGDEKRIKPFHWRLAFPNVFKQDGKFNAIIGNPPYGASFDKNEKEYLAQKYPMVSDFESAQYFIARANYLTQQDGYVSFIIPNTMLVNVFAKRFRDFICDNFCIEKIADLSAAAVFSAATVRTVIPILSKSKPQDKIVIENYDSSFTLEKTIKIKQTEIKDQEVWDFQSYQYQSLIKKIKQNAIPLNDILEISQGLIPYDKYRGHDEFTIKNRIWHANYKKDKTYKKELCGGDVKRYFLKWNGKNWISYGDWLAAPRRQDFFIKPRILIREITDGKINASFADEEYYNNPSIINCISRANNNYSMYFILGLINSKLLSKYHTITSPKARKGVFPKILVDDIRKLPIPVLEISDQSDKKKHDKIVNLVEQLLQLNNEKTKTKLQTEISQIETKIARCETCVNLLVNQLYGLNDEEIET